MSGRSLLAEAGPTAPARSSLPIPSAAWSDEPIQAHEALAQLQERIARSVMGFEDVVRALFAGLLCEGHILLEGVPGLAKTYLVRHFSRCLDLSFRRLQFTPDMLPSDILGTMTLDLRTQELAFRPGPVFANVVLADEINRAPPKVQSALLEAMQERQVTIDGVSHPLPRPFIVIATQNPVEQEGTYPLPEAELDRFLFRLLLSYPTEAKEIEMLQTVTADDDPGRGAPPVLGPGALAAISRRVADVYVDPDVLRYLSQVVRATRTDPRILLGASPRSAVQFLRAARAVALLEGRTYVIPDDVKRLAFPTLNHRLILRPEVLAQQFAGGAGGGSEAAQRMLVGLLDSLLRTLSVPR